MDANRDTSEVQKEFIASYATLCRGMELDLHDAYLKVDTIEALLNPGNIRTIMNRICSSDTALSVIDELCKHGKLPVDVTSPAFRIAYSSIASGQVCAFEQKLRIWCCDFVCLLAPFISLPLYYKHTSLFYFILF